MSGLVCISHLRWDFVWQRPQHLLSRIAKRYPVLFVEEPIHTAKVSEPVLEVLPGGTPNISVLRLLYPARHENDQRWLGHGDPETQAVYNKLLKEYLQTEGYNDPLLWLYTPMAHEFVEVLRPRLFIYDVMDQLSAFKGAPPALLEHERRMLQRADIVFTGGVSLYRDKKPFNAASHLFPSGVEVEHYQQAMHRQAFKRPADLPPADKPLLGYFGVIDERMDFELLNYVAQNRPDLNIVLVGPLAKIRREDLPQEPNIFITGMKNYQELPSYLAFFDVALVPFARNEATRFLSPTKTLEYMAAHKPIVATPIADLVELYGSVVHVAHTPQEFLQKIEVALKEDSSERRVQEGKLLSQARWDNIAEQMRRLIEEKLAERELSKFMSK